MAIVKRTEYEQVEPGQYTAYVRNVISREGKFGEYLQFEFEIDKDRDYDGFTVTGNAPQSFRAGSKLDAWILALGVDTRDMEPGDSFDTDELLDRKCRIIVISNKTKTKGGENVEYSNVSDVLPYKRRKEKKEEKRDDEDDRERPSKRDRDDKEERPSGRRDRDREEEDDPVERATKKDKRKPSRKREEEEDDFDF